jgi:peptidoglycan/LPS O-acetylase OafA/YrhL
MTEPRAGALSRLPSLTGMRFIAAFLVFACHASVLSYFTYATEVHLIRFSYVAGWIGVEFFFVLSGFVLTWSVRDGERMQLFWRRRLVKIYPDYLVVWIAAVLLAVYAGKSLGIVSWDKDWIPSLFLVHTWYPNLTVVLSNNAVTWTLGCEAFFYLLFPFLYRLIKRIPANGLWWAVGAVTAVIALLPLISKLFPGTPPMSAPNIGFPQEWFLAWFPVARCFDFVLGMLMAVVVRANRWPRFGIGPAFVVLAAGLTLQQYVFNSGWGLEATIALPLALVITAVAVADVSGQRSPFRARWLVWLGGISYAFYLVHFLVLAYGHVLIGITRTWPIPAATAVLAGGLAASIVVAWLLTRLVEEPMMRRWARPRPRPVAANEPVVTATDSTPESVS